MVKYNYFKPLNFGPYVKLIMFYGKYGIHAAEFFEYFGYFSSTGQ